MTNHFLVIFFYFSLLAILGLCTKTGRKYPVIVVFFPLLYIIKILIALALYENSLTALSGIGEFSTYDASSFYNTTLNHLHSGTSIIPDMHWSIADPGYFVLLYWVGIIYGDCLNINNIEYLHFLFFNIFTTTLIFFLLVNQLKKMGGLNSRVIVIAMALSLFDPTMLAFGSILEREILVALFLFLTFMSFIYNRWIYFLGLIFLLSLMRYEFVYIIPVIIICCKVYDNSYFKKHFLVYLVGLLVTFAISIQIISAMSERWGFLFFHHAMEAGQGSGFGDVIAVLPYSMRVIIYSVFGFLSPIPIYPVHHFSKESYEGFYLFRFLTGLGSIFYLCYHLIIINTILRLKKLTVIASGMISRSAAIAHYKIITKAYLFIFILHLVFQGLIYNVRHKVQIIPCLIFLALYCLQFYNIRQNALLVFFRLKNFAQSCFVIMVLNIVYLVAKVF